MNRCNPSWKTSTTRSSCRELRCSGQPSVLTRRFAHVKWIIRVVLLFLLTWGCLAADKPAGKDEKQKPDPINRRTPPGDREDPQRHPHEWGVDRDRSQKRSRMGHRPWHGLPGRQSRCDCRYDLPHRFYLEGLRLAVDPDASRPGKLSLDDPSLHTLAPEVWFDNPWESSEQVRVVNLLAHTTGWDDLHFREYPKQAPDCMSLCEGLKWNADALYPSTDHQVGHVI